jgi:hypothetical protein
MPTPVQWHTEDGASAEAPTQAADEPREAQSVLWKRMKRNLLFWQAPTEALAASVFGPPAVTPGQTVSLTVVVHPPAAAGNVATLVRAVQLDAELLGSGPLVREVAREAELAVHLGVTNAGAAKSMVTFPWKGRPHRLSFELHVPWESPAGPAPGLISIGQEDVRIGKVEFRLHVRPRKA